MVRLTDAAPLVYAYAHGLFAAEGVQVRLHVEPSWANVADKLAWGVLDGAIMLPPLAIAMALGLRPPATRLVIPVGISRNGNAVTLATPLADAVLADGPAPPEAIAARLRPFLPLRLASVHAFSTHDLLLRLFLESGGIDPAGDIAFSVVPPPDMPRALLQGRVDGFCAGAPWGAVAAEAGAGRTVAVSSAIMPDHPEKCLAMRAEWAETEQLRAVVRALDRAGHACADPAETPDLARLLAGSDWVGVPAALIAASLPGGVGGQVDVSAFGAPSAKVTEGLWFVQQMRRWRTLPANAETVVAAMYPPNRVAKMPGPRPHNALF
jgi:NitT/TauT family transport system ATP-binding protein/nitrate/nitrite transport system substrate-binding protein